MTVRATIRLAVGGRAGAFHSGLPEVGAVLVLVLRTPGNHARLPCSTRGAHAFFWTWIAVLAGRDEYSGARGPGNVIGSVYQRSFNSHNWTVFCFNPLVMFKNLEQAKLEETTQELQEYRREFSDHKHRVSFERLFP